MTKREDISRRGFIGSALSTAALSSLSPRELFAKGGAVGPGTQATTQREIPPLVDNPGWKEQGVENLTKSRYAKLRNVPVHAVTIKTGFWGRRRETNVSKSIPTMHDLLEANGRMTNFRRLTGKSQGAQSGPVYSDSDVYKWIEAAGFALQSGDRPELRATGEKLQLDLAGYILRGDERIKLPTGRTIYMFSGTPFTSRSKLEGHAVRAMYACCGATDYYMETGDASYWKTLNTLWDDMTRTKMYVTGGVGSREAGEAFGDAYELPNYRAYGESCAAIGNMMWNWRMLAATGDAKFTDVIERALYNGINSGMSLDGTLYCYRNPLAFDPSTGEKIRNPWYDTTCCPPNLERTLASLPGYFYSTSNDGIYLHLYDSSDLDWHLEDGTGLRVTQETNYPWDGSVKIGITPAKTAEFTFHLRIPGWAEHAQVTVNGKIVTGAKPGEYLPIQRRWAPGDVIHAQFEMTPQVLEASPHVTDDAGRVAVQRGPLIYCLEQLDQPDGVALSDVAVDLGHKSPALFESEFRGDLLGGIVVLRHTGAAYEKTNSRDALYSRYDGAPLKSRRVPLTFIPYYAWANRAAAAMQVWTPLLKA